MFKRFFTHPNLQTIRNVFIGIFVIFFLYHIVRYYIIDVDCDFSQGMLNNSIEGAMVVFGLITLLLNLFTFIGDVWQKKRRAILSLLFIAAVVSLLYLFLGNVVLECLFHGANMDGFFWGPT